MIRFIQIVLLSITTVISCIIYSESDTNKEHRLKYLAKRSVVSFTYTKPFTGSKGIYGSGFRLEYTNKYNEKYNLIITNRHICNVGKVLGTPLSVEVDGIPTTITSYSEQTDICILESNEQNFIGFKLANEASKVLDELLLIGHPSGNKTVITEGRLVERGVNTCIKYSTGTKCVKSDYISALVQGGSSGSPVLNKDLEVIGILYAGDSKVTHIPSIVPLELLKAYLAEMYDQ